ncbi:MAG: hypothetical protein WBZ35_16150, partial [Pseudolabrys sp.]
CRLCSPKASIPWATALSKVSLARPGGNLTGFTQFEYGLSVKWLELLKEIAPHISRVGVVRNAENSPVGIGQWAVLQTFAAPMGVELRTG